MTNWLELHYSWIMAAHLIALIAWMAGMFYLPRLYVYHVGMEPGSIQSETFKVMEWRLLRFIINPAMIATWLCGIAMLAIHPYLLREQWLHVKLVALIGMQICHALFARWRREFARDANKHDARFYKYWNEVPTLLLIIIVIMAVVKPF